MQRFRVSPCLCSWSRAYCCLACRHLHIQSSVWVLRWPTSKVRSILACSERYSYWSPQNAAYRPSLLLCPSRLHPGFSAQLLFLLAIPDPVWTSWALQVHDGGCPLRPRIGRSKLACQWCGPAPTSSCSTCATRWRSSFGTFASKPKWVPPSASKVFQWHESK